MLRGRIYFFSIWHNRFSCSLNVSHPEIYEIKNTANTYKSIAYLSTNNCRYPKNMLKYPIHTNAVRAASRIIKQPPSKHHRDKHKKTMAITIRFAIRRGVLAKAIFRNRTGTSIGRRNISVNTFPAGRRSYVMRGRYLKVKGWCLGFGRKCWKGALLSENGYLCECEVEVAYSNVFEENVQLSSCELGVE